MSQDFRHLLEGDQLPSIVTWILPIPVRSDRDLRLALARWALLGLLLRLAVMPFTMHTDWRFVGDMVAMNSEAMKVLQGQLYPPRGYPPLAYWTMALFLFLFKPLMPVFPLAPIFQPDSILHWNASPLVFRYAFLMKSWYLPFDLAIALLLLRLVGDERQALRAWQFWMVNPLVLYTGYIHGEFDLAPAFVVVLSLYFAKKGQVSWAVFWLGIGACYKNYPLFFLLPAVFLLGSSASRTRFPKLRLALQWIKLFLIGTLPYVLLVAPRYLLRSVRVSGETAYYGIYLFPAKLEIGFGQVVYLFIALYLLIVWYVYGKSEAQSPKSKVSSETTLDIGRWTSDAKPRFDLLWRAMLAILLLYYSVSVAALHYYTWAMPMAALLFAEDRRVLVPYLAALAGVLGISISLTRSLAGALLTPISPLFFQSLSSPAELIEPHLPVIAVVSVGRSVLAGTAAWIGYQALRPRLKAQSLK